jgi:hypothetical protein
VRRLNNNGNQIATVFVFFGDVTSLPMEEYTRVSINPLVVLIHLVIMITMTQKGAGLIIPILVVAILAVGALVFLGKKDAPVAKAPAPSAPQGIAVGEPNPAQPVTPAETPDAVVDAILVDATAEAATADASADADLIQTDTNAINSYGNAYDATSF